MHDLKFAVRQLLKNPGFTAVGVITLALGIGANTAIFSYVDQLLVRSLPVENPHELAVLGVDYGDGRPPSVTFSYPLFSDYRDQNQLFTQLSAQADRAIGLGVGDTTERVRALVVSDNYFSMLGVQPALGRTFTPTEKPDQADPTVTVLSHGLWHRRFGGDPGIIGRVVTLNGLPFTVIGVAPSEFRGTIRALSPDLYVPMGSYPRLESQRFGDEHPLQSRAITWHQILGRLRPGITHQQAQAGMRLLARLIHDLHPENTVTNVVVLKGNQGVTAKLGEARMPLLLLMAIVVLVLLIACANVANLLLARAASRQREVAIRLSVGASRMRVLRQLLTESVLLAVLGGLAGILVAVWLADVLAQFRPPGSAGTLTFGVDSRILGFALVISVLTGVVFGVAPAWETSRPDLIPALKGAGAAGGRLSRWNLRNLLVVFQVAVSLLVLICAGLCIRSMRNLHKIDLGFDPAKVVLMSFDLELNNYNEARARDFFDQLLARTRSLPGVDAASLARSTPLGSSHIRMSVERVEGYEPPPGEFVNWDVNVIAPDHFRALSLPLLHGREFNEKDLLAAPKVAVVNEVIAQRYWPGQEPIGKLVYQSDFSGGEIVYQIVGVVKTSKARRLTEEPQPIMYLPHAQQPRPERAMTLLVRTTLASQPIIASLRELARVLDPNLPVFNIQTLEQQRFDSLFLQRMAATMLGGFGVLALMLAAIGIYGVMAYAVSRRTHEVGIRMAMGAQRRDVLRLIVGQGVLLTLVGLAVGLAGALAATRVMTSLLHEVQPSDPATFLVTSAVLVGVALLACWLPARRATRVDPVVALRCE